MRPLKGLLLVFLPDVGANSTIYLIEHALHRSTLSEFAMNAIIMTTGFTVFYFIAVIISYLTLRSFP